MAHLIKNLRILLVSPITFLYYLNKNMVSRSCRRTLRGIHKKKVRLLSRATEPKVPIKRCSIMLYSNQSLSNQGLHKIISSSSRHYGSMVNGKWGTQFQCRPLLTYYSCINPLLCIFNFLMQRYDFSETYQNEKICSLAYFEMQPKMPFTATTNL